MTALDVGRNGASDGTLNIDGSGSRVAITGNETYVSIGRWGQGEVNITNGGRLEGLDLSLGDRASGVGTLNVDSQSLVRLEGQNQGAQFGAFMGVGLGGFGTANIEGRVEIGSDTGALPGFTVGGLSSDTSSSDFKGGTGALNLTGPDASIAISGRPGSFNIGGTGTGTLNMSDGAEITGALLGTFGTQNGSFFSGTIDNSSIQLSGIGDAGSGFEGQGAFLSVGRGGDGTLGLTNNASITIDPGGTVAEGDGAGFQIGGSTNLPAGGTGVLNVDASEIRVRGDNAQAFIGVNGLGRLNITNGGQVVMEDADEAADNGLQAFVGFDQDGSGFVTIDGAGSVLDVGEDFFIGQNAEGEDTGSGIVVVSNGGELRAETTTIGTNGILGGNGSVTGTTIVNGGLLAPGLSPGTLTLENLVFNNGILQLEIEADGQQDKLIVEGTSILNGQIEFIFGEGVQLSELDLDDFIQASVGGNIVYGENLSFKAAGFVLGNFDPESGTLEVAPVPLPAAAWFLLTALASIFSLRLFQRRPSQA